MSDSEVSVEWIAESRFRYEPIEPVPSDWRFIHHEFHNESGLHADHPWWALYTHEVEGEPIRRRVWVKLRQIRQERRVTPWTDV